MIVFDCLVGGLLAWLAVWVFHGLTCLSAACLIHGLFDFCFVDCLLEWLMFVCLSCCLVDCVVSRAIAGLTDSFDCLIG